MIVKNLIQQFEGFEVLAGETGLDKSISTVSVMDAPDIYNWMKGGEFLITTGYIMKDNPIELIELVTKLKENGASALGIKLGRFIGTLPSQVKNIADDIGFPIIYIPTSYAFTDIINPVLSQLVNTQAEKLLMSERIHNSFTKLVIEGKGNSDIVNTLYDILNIDLAFVDLIFDRTYIKSNSESFRDEIKEKSYNNYYKFSVQIGSLIYGYLILKETPLEEMDKTTLEHASTVLKLNTQKKISNHQIEQKYRDEFIQDLLVNNIRTVEEANNRAALYGWKMDKGLICLIVDLDNLKERFISLRDSKTLENERTKIFHLVTKTMKQNFLKCYYTNYSDSIVFLIEPDSTSMEKFLIKLKTISKAIRKQVRDNSSFTVTVGIGTYRENIIDIYLSFLEAQRSVRIGRTVHEGDQTFVYTELGIYRMLYNMSKKDEMVDFCNDHLKKLMDYDLEYNTKYIDTLHCLIKNDWNLKKTSEDMFIHYNTMKYRYKKISEIIKLDDRQDKFIIEFCLMLMDMSNQYSLYMKANI